MKRRAAETLSLTEAAERLGVSRTSAYRAAREGRFPVPIIHVGARMRVARRALDRLLSGERQDPSDAA